MIYPAKVITLEHPTYSPMSYIILDAANYTR